MTDEERDDQRAKTLMRSKLLLLAGVLSRGVEGALGPRWSARVCGMLKEGFEQPRPPGLNLT